MDQESNEQQTDGVSRVPIYCGKCSEVYAGRQLESGRVIPIGVESCRCGNSEFAVLEA